MRSINRIVKIHETKDFKISCLFNNGESRIIDFEKLFRKWHIDKNHIAHKITKNLNSFEKFELEEGTLIWKNVSFKSVDDTGMEITQYFDLDPIVLYENSEPDESRSLNIGMMIRKVRKQSGMTQEQLARRTGTSKHYISRIENEKSGIEIMTLKKIVEGLGKKLQISIN